MRLSKKLKTMITALEDKKAEALLVYDVKNKTPLAEYYILVSANNPRQLNALYEAVDKVASVNNYPIHHVEGRGKSKDWILVDAYEIIVHIFSKQARNTYALEELLHDAKLVYQT
jgi:ribosome-associated protein